MDKMNFLEFARERYSCRKLTGAPVAAEKLERILEAARIARPHTMSSRSAYFCSRVLRRWRRYTR